MSDDGEGMVPSEASGPQALGLQLVESLVRQLDGTLETRSDDDGTSVEIVFATRARADAGRSGAGRGRGA